jgi:hypothetical protein
MKIKSTFLGLMIVAIMFGGIFASSALNMWKTESSKIPQKLMEGDFAGEYNPADIRGSYSFSDVSSAFNIPTEDLKRAFGVSQEIDPSVFKNKDLEVIYSNLGDIEIGNTSVKLFVALYSGLPYEIDEDIYLPKSAVEILKAKASLTKEQIDYLDNYTIDLAALSQEVTTESSVKNHSHHQGTNEEHDPVDGSVRGQTTFKEVLDWGVKKEVIEKIIGGKIPPTGMTIRDYCIDKGIEFSTVKGALQNELDNI